nr:MAG TPA: hypothetical protein [Caudoviricetes sp.]
MIILRRHQSVGWCFFRGEMEVAGCILCRMLF